MAKKSKLSSREKAAKAAGGTLNYKTGKISVPTKQSTVKKTSSVNTSGMSPAMAALYGTNSKPVSNYAKMTPTGGANDTKKYASNDYSSTDGSSKKKAAKAYNASKSNSLGNGVRTAFGINTANASDGASISAPTKKGFFARGAEIVKDPFGLEPKIRGLMQDKPWEQGARGLMGYDANPIYQTEKGIGDALSQALSGVTPEMGISESLGNDTTGVFGNDEQPRNNPINTNPTVDDFMPNVNTGNNANDNNDNRNDNRNNPWEPGNQNANSPEALAQVLQGNDAISPALPDDPGRTVGNRSGRGNGMFGTGKGVGNPAGEDPYIKELRKAYASNGGEKYLRKQFEELIKQLDPTYAQMTKEGTDSLNAQLQNNNTQLASVMNANNVGDSEQRAQLMAGQQRDTSTALGNLLAKLATAKAGDVSGYKSQMNSALASNADKNQSNQQRLMEAIQGYRDKQQSREDQFTLAGMKKSGGSTSAGSVTYVGNDKNGNPVYRNSKTGQMQTMAGITRPHAQTLAEQLQEAGMLGQGGQDQGGETDANGTPIFWNPETNQYEYR